MKFPTDVYIEQTARNKSQNKINHFATKVTKRLRKSCFGDSCKDLINLPCFECFFYLTFLKGSPDWLGP